MDTLAGARASRRNAAADRTEEATAVSLANKLRNRFRMAKGRTKARTGRATGDPYLEAEGRGERVGGAARQVSEQAKDAGRNARDAFKE
jgi:uncharacterized protein YjbJ (UPF0337 family)